MAEDNGSQSQQREDPNGTPQQQGEFVSKAEYEKLLAHSRTWEDKAKRLSEKAKKYDELAAQSMTDAEKLEAAAKRADDAESKLAAYEAEAKRAKDAAEVAEKTGVPASLLTETDRKAMEQQAASILAFAQGQPSAPVFRGDGTKPDGGAKASPRQQFADLMQQFTI